MTIADPRHRAGRAAETLARCYLCGKGLRFVTQNFRCRGGELDLVMLDGEDLVFVEVRFRRSARYGSAAETVDAHKRRRIVTAARHYLQRHPQARHRASRFDVVSFSGTANEDSIEWIRAAFDAE